MRAREIAADVQAGRRTAEAVIRETLERLAAYDAVQAHAWIERALKSGRPEPAKG